MFDADAVKTLKLVFESVPHVNRAQSLIRSAARAIILKDFDHDFPNPMPRNRPVKQDYQGAVPVEHYTKY